MDDLYWMQQALLLAEHAAQQGEVPVGAVLVTDEGLLAQGFNRPICDNDPCAHAEIIALRAGGKARNNYRLINSTLYVTLEPCVMCVGAIIHARIKRLVFGAYDTKTGAIQSVFQMLDTHKFNHKIDYIGGVLAEPCGKLLTDFFRARR